MKRADERMGHPKAAAGAPSNVDKIEFVADLRIPEPNPDWSYIAQYSWESYLNSPGSLYYSDTDLVYGWMTCDAIDVAFKDKSAMKVAAADSMMRAGLFNEADRRKARIEYTRKPTEPNPEADANIAEYRARRGRPA
jgi:hypothetical protein